MWLSASLLEWYFDAVSAGADLGIIGIMAKLGATALVVGVVLGVVGKQRPLLLFLLPIATAHAYVAAAAFFEGSMSYPSHYEAVAVPFLLTQLAICLYLVFKTARVAALFLAIFVLTYSWHAGFIGGMALSGDWL